MDERWVLVCHGDALGGHQELVGMMLRDFDPEAREGRGECTWTGDPAKAMHFPDLRNAMAMWRTQSRTVPLRPDGQPNRPLTAFTIEPLRLA